MSRQICTALDFRSSPPIASGPRPRPGAVFFFEQTKGVQVRWQQLKVGVLTFEVTVELRGLVNKCCQRLDGTSTKHAGKLLSKNILGFQQRRGEHAILLIHHLGTTLACLVQRSEHRENSCGPWTRCRLIDCIGDLLNCFMRFTRQERHQFGPTSQRWLAHKTTCPSKCHGTGKGHPCMRTQAQQTATVCVSQCTNCERCAPGKTCSQTNSKVCQVLSDGSSGGLAEQ